ncbi:site-specific integrase [Erythrobacter sp. SN021]|uniref:site-specific integrase n=1 Tax=Erythrobacter sp. SN021 TaxID=2912574 RepID=UPI001F484E7F|nr:site-specific integrase [Erythrobacter sp. SN021]MCF8882699.1 site-specific integrase [Erythrobacter sp. SN021]
MPASSKVRLTKTIVDTAVPTAKRYAVWDSELAGFAVRIEPTGTKSFVVRYRADGGGRTAPQRYVTIGRFGNLTVEEARKKAKKVLGQIAVGEDPAAARNSKRVEMKVAALVDLYEAEGCYIQRGVRQGEPMKPLTKQYTIGRLRHHVVRLLGHKRITELTAGDTERFFRDVESGKSRKDEKVGPRKRILVRGGPGAARKVFRDLSAMYSFAVRRGLVEVNPCDKAVVRKTDGRRTRFLSLAEVRKLGEACDALEKEGLNSKALIITRLWILTGCRRQEIVELKWSEVDFERGLLTLADSKTGQSVRPLAGAAIGLLKGISRSYASDYVFPAECGEGYFQGTKKLWPKIVSKAGLTDVTPHTLRHTMGAIATSSGEALAMTGAILGHANMRSTMIYAHVDHDPMKAAADRVGIKIADALGCLR